MTPIERKACRGLLLTPDNEILLIKISNPTSDWVGWITPGGGMDPGETEMETLKRELKEELGFQLNTEAIKIWRRRHSFSWGGKDYDQSEVYFLVRTPKFELTNTTSLTEGEMMDFKETRWWKLDALESSGEMTTPRDLATRLIAINMDGPPKEVETVGI